MQCGGARGRRTRHFVHPAGTAAAPPHLCCARTAWKLPPAAPASQPPSPSLPLRSVGPQGGGVQRQIPAAAPPQQCQAAHRAAREARAHVPAPVGPENLTLTDGAACCCRCCSALQGQPCGQPGGTQTAACMHACGRGAWHGGTAHVCSGGTVEATGNKSYINERFTQRRRRRRRSGTLQGARAGALQAAQRCTARATTADYGGRRGKREVPNRV